MRLTLNKTLKKADYLLENYSKYKDNPIKLELTFGKVYNKHFRFEVIQHLMSLKKRWLAIDYYVNGAHYIKLNNSDKMPFDICLEDLNKESKNWFWFFIFSVLSFATFFSITEFQIEKNEFNFPFLKDNFPLFLITALSGYASILAITENEKIRNSKSLHRILNEEDRYIS